jgi:hypothetical protein
MKLILDLCGGTGAWSAPYRDNGYKVINVTLPEYDVRTFNPPRNVYGILAAPPCTMFSLARTRAKKPRSFKEGMELVEACLHIIWEIRKIQKLAFWALENPMGYLRQFLGKPPLTFDPCDYGDPYTKKTDLWGYYNEPKKKPVKLDEETKYRCSQNTRKLPSISDFTGSKQADRRAITPRGFAEAFYEANK